MNNKYKEEQLFEALKKLPPEISEAKVHAIIQTLPLLPIPKTHWIHQINLNSIIMSSTVITFIVGTTLLLTNIDRPETLVNNTQPMEESTLTPVIEEEIVKEVEKKEVEGKAPENTVLREPISTPRLPQQSISSTPTTIYDLPELLPLPKTSLSEIVDTSESTTNVTKKEPEWTPINLRLKRCKRTPNISDSGIKLLKIRLLNKLKKDEVIASKKDKMIISFNKNGILVNNQLLAANLQNKYLDFLRNYDITPCKNRLVITTPEYIAVGNHTVGGFKGHVDGRVSLEELKLYQSNNSGLWNKEAKENKTYNDDFGDELDFDLGQNDDSLFPQKEERAIEDFHSLKVEGLAVVYLSNNPSPTAKLKVSGMPIKDVTTEVVDGVLMIATRGEHSGEKISIEIGAANLRSIEVGGAAELRSEEQLVSEQMSIFVADTGAAWLDVDVEKLTIWMKGGDLFIKGKANSKNTILKFGENHESGTLDYSGLKSKE